MTNKTPYSSAFGPRRASLAALGWLAVSMLCGCETTGPKVDVMQPTQARPLPSSYAPSQNGAIFQSAAYRPLYESHRARLVGDIINVQITEAVTAKQAISSSLEKQGSLAASISALPFLAAANLTNLNLGATGSSDNKFSGTGSTAADNTFTGTITTTVLEVLPNGHLLVSGEKQIGIGSQVDVLRFSGQIDPYTIQPGNTVASTQVANVRIEQMGRGQEMDAQQIGWLGKFFLSVSPF